MTAALENWLGQATRQLAKKSADCVRAEIQEHFESSREEYIAGGATPDEADRLALNALGDARTANCQYRQVLLTASEARILRTGSTEARFFCASLPVMLLRVGVTIAFLAASLLLFFAGRMAGAQATFALGLVTGLLFVAPLLPIYTPSRSRVFRYVKWALMAGALTMVFGRDALRMSWLLLACVWPAFWLESVRNSIRRKLPVTAWPRQLYL